MKKVILAGYMGSGKSAVAQALRLVTGFDLIELDTVIEQSAGSSIKEIFANRGEIYFRKLEHDALKSCLSVDRNIILSLGGGTPCYYNNMQLITTSEAVTFYLKASINTLLSRLNNQSGQRPMLVGSDSAQMQEFIAKHLFERRHFYEQCNFSVVTDDKTPEEVAKAIISILGKEGVIPFG